MEVSHPGGMRLWDNPPMESKGRQAQGCGAEPGKV